MALAYIGLGGNVGDVVANMAGALQLLDKSDDITVTEVSPVYRTPPWGIEEQDWFHNACAALETTLQPSQFLDKCLETERVFKRERDVRWGPRTLDLDILLIEDMQVDEDRLTIPHPRMHERSFVLKPLQDLAPDLNIFGKTPAIWLEALGVSEMQLVALDKDWWKSSR
ncbi:MAG: 2-amino-4-hydroxy-6-hydroxymethyldihydropteridine diphosphokinase [Pseudomonadota bacterium]